MSVLSKGELRRTRPGGLHPVFDHAHRGIEVNLVLRGSGQVTIEGLEVPLRPGTLIWITPLRQHQFCRGPSLEMWVMEIPVPLMPPEALRFPPADLVQSVDRMDLIGLDRLLARVALDADDPVVYEAGLAYAVQSLWRAGSSQRGDPRRSIRSVSTALALLADKPELNLAKIAYQIGVSPDHLGRLIRGETGRGFVEWRNGIRIDRFVDEFREGDNLAAAALNAGFGSYARFHEAFCAALHMTPGDWVAQRSSDGEITARFAEIGDAPILNARHRWAQLARAAPTLISKALGPNFLERLAKASPSNEGRPIARFPNYLSQEQLLRLQKAIGATDAALAAEFTRLFANESFAQAGIEVMHRYEFEPEGFVDVACALLMMLWICSTDGSDPPVRSAWAARRQTANVLANLADRLEPAALRDAHTAMFCHYTILMHGLFAARASGTPAATADLAKAVIAQAKLWAGGDPTTLHLTDAGFRRS